MRRVDVSVCTLCVLLLLCNLCVLLVFWVVCRMDKCTNNRHELSKLLRVPACVCVWQQGCVLFWVVGSRTKSRRELVWASTGRLLPVYYFCQLLVIYFFCCSVLFCAGCTER